MMWTHDSETGTYSIGNLTPLELSTAVAAVITGYAVVSADTLGAEAARRNLMNHIRDLGDSESNRLLEVFIAADAHRIHTARRRDGLG